MQKGIKYYSLYSNKQQNPGYPGTPSIGMGFLQHNPGSTLAQPWLKVSTTRKARLMPTKPKQLVPFLLKQIYLIRTRAHIPPTAALCGLFEEGRQLPVWRQPVLAGTGPRKKAKC